MLEIKEIIKRLSEDEMAEFGEMLEDSKAEKSHALFHLLKDGKQSDERITEMLGVNSTAYYTLRSRLYDKLQEFMLHKIEGPKLDILEKVNNIEYIIFNYTPTQAFSILQKLESELRKYDQPIYLLKVYDALMRLTKQPEQHFNFSQLYNSNLTFLIDYEKTQELLADFLRAIAEHMLGRQPEILDRLHLIVDQMLEKEAQYEQSSRIRVLAAIVSIYYQLYLDEEKQEVDLKPVEDIFREVYDVIEQNKKDHYFNNLKLLFDYLNFRYYNNYGIKKKEEEYYERVDDNLLKFLNSYGFYCIPSQFLKGKLQKALQENELEKLQEENEVLIKEYDVDSNDVVNYVNFYMYLAYAYLYAREYERSNNYLNDVRNNISFKNYPHMEMEVKSMLSINYVMLGEYELSNSLIKSIGRKITSLEYHDYPNLKIFRKIMQNALKSPSKDRKNKMNSLMHEYNQLNQGNFIVMDALQVDEDFIEQLLKH